MTNVVCLNLPQPHNNFIEEDDPVLDEEQHFVGTSLWIFVEVSMDVSRLLQHTWAPFTVGDFNGSPTESPKACGHTQGRKVVSREEAVIGSDIVIVARTDARQALSLDEALYRSRTFADAGADVVFIDALASRQEMEAFCQVSPLVPKMANMLEGGGKTPILTPLELQDIGYKIVAYRLSLIAVSIRAMQMLLLLHILIIFESWVRVFSLDGVLRKFFVS
ncbi:phosphoenolpyruvate phosphomutase [Medicago truncatula]|uniref:Phosphoenolpyruvate phosphomutase n=1 Tax=Medicago truncatula TaxID=3880 RepID=A0A072TX89_MEDTR|nr:phosphoenolpyruvate phosphomutase [Medicago truncatula]